MGPATSAIVGLASTAVTDASVAVLSLLGLLTTFVGAVWATRHVQALFGGGGGGSSGGGDSFVNGGGGWQNSSGTGDADMARWAGDVGGSGTFEAEPFDNVTDVSWRDGGDVLDLPGVDDVTDISWRESDDIDS